MEMFAFLRYYRLYCYEMGKEIVYYYNTHKGDDTFERKKEQKDNQKKIR